MTVVTFHTYAPLPTPPHQQPLFAEHPPTSNRTIALDLSSSLSTPLSGPPPWGGLSTFNRDQILPTLVPVHLDTPTTCQPSPKTAPTGPALVLGIQRLLRELSRIPPPPLPYRRPANAARSAPLPAQSTLAPSRPAPARPNVAGKSYRDTVTTRQGRTQLAVPRQLVPLRRQAPPLPPIARPQGPPPIPLHSRPTTLASYQPQPESLAASLACLSRKQLIDILLDALGPLNTGAPQFGAFRPPRHRAFRPPSASENRHAYSQFPAPKRFRSPPRQDAFPSTHPNRQRLTKRQRRR
jgi:hypothetical protein